jgi:hypothetical protein
MGQISDKLLKRQGRGRKLATEIRREAEAIREALDALKRGEATRIAPGVALDPLHAVYVAVQHTTSVFAERVSVLPEFKPYYQLAAQAEEPNQWPEFIFGSYHHQFDAIFLTGLPDVLGSLPHA